MKKEQYKELFDFLNLSQRGFAREYNIPASTISEIVNGRIKNLPLEVAYRLHKECGISLDWLVKGEGAMFDTKNTDTFSNEETELFLELRKDPKLIGAIKSFIKALKENYK
ncbi:MAG: helix-turn-helix domain-containing protein [Leptospiraceae bacterium]|nr:helix-turn-helix domain-containing protein [Leptospiraceae bacterium]MCP5501076.1 helix-turn-helix domain-containing protein [Leptospiraceae bacterium]